MINKNFKCPPHKDKNNIGDSIILGLGDYNGGDLVVEGEGHCLLYSPFVFNGSQQRTHWFYERVRGEYLNDQAYLTPGKKNQFKSDYPPSQKIEKTFISKSELSWLRMPYVVAKGVASSFDKFADIVTDKVENDNLSITEDYFRHVISRVIMFRALEKLISGSDWYDGGLRAQTVTYSMAYLSELISRHGKHLDFEKNMGFSRLAVKHRVRS